MTASRSTAPLAPWLVRTILVCFFFSGATSLMLETAWSKVLSYLLGTDLYGAATTIIAYMGGLGLGALLAARVVHKLGPPLRGYAALQVFIGVLGLVSVPALFATAPLFEALYLSSESRTVFLAIRFLITFLVMLPATTLMGMTLPVVIGTAGSSRLATARFTGLVYGVNTLGAVVGALAAGFFVIPRLGLTMSCVVTGFVDLTLAALLFWLHRKVSLPSPAPARHRAWSHQRDRLRRIPASVFLSGACALGLELCWFRTLGQLIGPTVQAFSVTLAVFLTGIGLGSVLSSRWLPRFSSGVTALVFFLLASALFAVLPIAYLDRLPSWYQTLWFQHTVLPDHLALPLTQGLLACALMLPATLATGAVFPAAIQAAREVEPEASSLPEVSGYLFSINTIGALLGTIVWGFVVVPRFGADVGIRTAASCSLLAALFVGVRWGKPLELATRHSGARRWGQLAAIALAGTAVVLIPEPDTRALNAGVFTTIKRDKREHIRTALHPRAKVVFTEEGVNASIVVVSGRYGGPELDLAYSGKWVASTRYAIRRSLHLLGHLPMLLARTPPKKALVIGLGTGITSGSLLRHQALESLDIVEIEPAVLDASRLFSQYNGDPLDDRRTRLVLEDGRTFISFGAERFDLITSDPIHPWVKGAANLYTSEYYHDAARRLNPGGIFCQWIPSTMAPRSFKSILRTLRSAFPHVSFLFSSSEAMAFAAHEPIRWNPETIRARMATPAVHDDLARIQLPTAEKVIELFEEHLYNAPTFRDSDVIINTDDNVFLEHQLPWDLFRGSRTRPRPKQSTRQSSSAPAR